ncbi:MAG: chlorite dismutase family protein [Acidobacteria bacterium]|nr:chlorite dismutase family protein [Acidobacteriota bacterium]
MPAPLVVTFSAGDHGLWRVDQIRAVRGEGLASAPRLAVLEDLTSADGAVWSLRGVTSHARYTTRAEDSLLASASALGRHEATRAALIPIRKTEEWWNLAQDERRAIFEERSQHIQRGSQHIAQVARRLHHSRDLGEPFDFLTWFEYAPAYAEAFEEFVSQLRETEEWHYVEREVDVRLRRDGS